MMCRPCVDHTGREHPSFLAMCRAWGWSYPSIIRQRLSLMWGMEAALTTRELWSRVTKDHMGVHHQSFRAMCRAWGKSPNTVDKRLARGIPLDKALTMENERPGRLGDCRGVAWGRIVLDKWIASRLEKAA